MESVNGTDYRNIQVYLGLWTNWSHGRIQGSTLTLTRQNTALLIAFLALFVGAAGNSFWRIGCFVLHQCFSIDKPQDGVYHQRQAILRNSSTALDAASALLFSLWAWMRPKRAKGPFHRLLPTLLFSLVVAAAFAVSSVFSSRVTSNTNNEVLILSDNCGAVDPSLASSAEEEVTILEPYVTSKIQSFMNYALQCYKSTSTSARSENCQLFIKPRLPILSTTNASCPFPEELCQSNSSNLILDTGYIDSHKDLGINMPPEDRFLFRLVNHCAPLTTTGFSEIHQVSGSSSSSMMRYYYGEVPTAGGTEPYGNYTYELPANRSISYTNDTGLHVEVDAHPAMDYSISTHIAYSDVSQQDASTFYPIPQLQRADADVTLFFLSGTGIRFMGDVDDPWYSAHRLAGQLIDYLTNTSTNYYFSDEAASVLGCTTQMQYCDPNLPPSIGCEPLHGLISYGPNQTNSTETDHSMIDWPKELMDGMITPVDVLGYLGVAGLLSRYSLSRGTQGPLPNNQWQIEVQNWMEISLASLQSMFVDTAAGPPRAQLDQYLGRPDTDEARRTCRNQKMLSTDFSSFSILGLAIIFCVGGLFIILDYTIEFIYGIIQKRFFPNHHSKTYSRLEWHANATLQLQRLAHEELGLGTWSRTTEVNPVTLYGEQLGVLNVEQDQHPLLQVPRKQELVGECEKGEQESGRIMELPRDDVKGGGVDVRTSMRRSSEADHESQATLDATAGSTGAGDQSDPHKYDTSWLVER